MYIFLLYKLIFNTIKKMEQQQRIQLEKLPSNLIAGERVRLDGLPNFEVIYTITNFGTFINGSYNTDITLVAKENVTQDQIKIVRSYLKQITGPVGGALPQYQYWLYANSTIGNGGMFFVYGKKF